MYSQPVDFAIVISEAFINLQHRLEKIQHDYSQSHQRVRPSFRHIRAVAERIEATRIIQAVHQSTDRISSEENCHCRRTGYLCAGSAILGHLN